MTRFTDTDKLYAILEPIHGNWMSQANILDAFHRRYGHGVTVHSRAADLRKRGLDVRCRLEHRNGRVVSFYSLVKP